MSAILIATGSLISEIHYRPYSRYWWGLPSLPNREFLPYFPIRVGQKIHIYLNERNFCITIQVGENTQPQYECICDNFRNTASSLSTAISNVYEAIFHNKTRYSGPLIMGWTNKNIIQELSEDVEFFPVSVTVGTYKIFLFSVGTSSNITWKKAGNGYKSSLVHSFGRKASVFVSKIEKEKCILEIYQESHVCKKYVGATPDEVWKNSGFIQKYKGHQLFGLDNQEIQRILYKHRGPTCKPENWNDYQIMKTLFDYYLKRRTIANINWHNFFTSWLQDGITIIEINSKLKAIYPVSYEFDGDREKNAWLSMLRAAGCTDVTPWSHEKSEVIFIFIIYLSYKFYYTKTEKFFFQLQLWSRSSNANTDKTTLESLYKLGFLVSTPLHSSDTILKFWSCFDQALADNKKTHDGKRRVLSIIADNFTYLELEKNLGVSINALHSVVIAHLEFFFFFFF